MVAPAFPFSLVARVASSGGVTLPLYDFGGHGPRLLIAHATGFHGRCYLPLAQALPTFRVAALDLRGHGDAGVPEPPHFDWHGFRDDILAAIAALAGTGPLFGFGHSMGAAALLLAEQHRPGTFSALCCYEPIAYPPQNVAERPAESPIARAARRRREHFASFADALLNFRAKPPLDTFDPAALACYVRYGFRVLADGSVCLKMSGEHEALVYGMSLRHSAYEGLGAVRCPVQVARGRSAEPFAPAAVAPAIAAGLPHGRLVTFDDLHHLGPFEQPIRVAESVRVFFDSVLTAAAG